MVMHFISSACFSGGYLHVLLMEPYKVMVCDEPTARAFYLYNSPLANSNTTRVIQERNRIHFSEDLKNDFAMLALYR